GDVVSRLRDDPALIVDQLDCICDLIGRSSFLIVAGVVVWNVDSTVTLILLAPIALTTLLSVSVGRRLRSLRAAARSAAGGVSAFLAEIVAAQLAVKVAGASERVVGRLNHLSDSRRKAQVRTKTFDAFITGVNL